MLLKSIEMQVALPRTQDAGKMQEQLQKQGEQLQSILTASQLEEEKLKRTRVQETEHTVSLKQKNDSEKDGHGKSEKKREKGYADFRHPYLGKRIDYNG